MYKTGVGQQLDKLRFAHRSPLPSRVETLAERFRDAGYRTAAVVGNPWASSFFGLDQGFQRFLNPSIEAESFSVLREVPLAALVLRLVPDSWIMDDRAESIRAKAEQWLDEPGDAPLFLWLHFIDPHAPWELHPEASTDNSMLVELAGTVALSPDGALVGERFSAVHALRAGDIRLDKREQERIRQLYRAEVAYVDQQIGLLMRGIRSRKDPPLVAFAADHGEEFWEHGGFEHAHDYYREVTHVPLILWWPGSVPAGRVLSQPVGLIDLGPTLLELAGIPLDGGGALDEGVSLVEIMNGVQQQGAPRISENNTFGIPSRLVVDGNWRFISRENGQQELYDVIRDPGETRNLALDLPQVSAGFVDYLREHHQQDQLLNTRSAPSAAAMEGLKALGYIE